MDRRQFSFFYDRKKNLPNFTMKELKTTFHNFTKCLVLSSQQEEEETKSYSFSN